MRAVDSLHGHYEVKDTALATPVEHGAPFIRGMLLPAIELEGDRISHPPKSLRWLHGFADEPASEPVRA